VNAFCRMLVLLLAIAAAAPALARKAPPEYTGSDGGYLVYAVGTIAIGMNFDFPYRRISAADGSAVTDWKGVIEPTVGGAWVLKIKNPDFLGRESGHVVVRRLPPGRYVIDQFAFAGGGMGMPFFSWSSAKPFRIPFSIRPGQSTYIGSFMRAPSLGTPLQPQLNAAGYFLIADRSDRDLPIARRKNASVDPVTVEVTDVGAFDSIVLRNSEP
jgi:hypothetical protein